MQVPLFKAPKSLELRSQVFTNGSALKSFVASYRPSNFRPRSPESRCECVGHIPSYLYMFLHDCETPRNTLQLPNQVSVDTFIKDSHDALRVGISALVEARTRIASSLSRVWASPAFTVIFLTRHLRHRYSDLFQKSFTMRPLMFNGFTFRLHIVTQSICGITYIIKSI